jgi:protein-S-isoprenylcysteine O-methyltransferase Ste14
MADLQTPAVEPGAPLQAPSRAKQAVQAVVAMGTWIAIVFIAAGRIDWPRGLACSAVYVATMSITGVIVNRVSPGLLQQRAKWKHAQTPTFDRVFLAAHVPLSFGQIAVAGLDAGRFHWLPLPGWTFFPAAVLFVASMAMVVWVFATNPFAETIVRIQSERGHHVICAGPYRAIRHPMYAAMLMMYPATGLMFGSGWALAASSLIVVMIVWRTAREDGYLRENLTGYADFASHTRYRLLPGVW